MTNKPKTDEQSHKLTSWQTKLSAPPEDEQQHLAWQLQRIHEEVEMDIADAMKQRQTSQTTVSPVSTKTSLTQVPSSSWWESLEQSDPSSSGSPTPSSSWWESLVDWIVIHKLTASLLLFLLVLWATSGIWLAKEERQRFGSHTQPIAKQKTHPPPRPMETRQPEPSPCYVDATDSQQRATLASYAKTDEGHKFIEKSKGLRCSKLVRIPKGTFMQGSPDSDTEAHDDEKPQHPVKLTRDIAMWKTEVTQQEFQDVMGYNPSYHKDCPTCPVERVSWHEAVAYSLKLSLKIGLISSVDQACFSCTGTRKQVRCSLRDAYAGKKYYTCPGFRLPTEAEWEYAARGSKPRYGKLDDIACYPGRNSGYTSRPVCTKTSMPRPYGLCDILGNVLEWTWDWYQKYPKSLKKSINVNPAGPYTGSRRVTRGGSCSFYARFARAADRYNEVPSGRGINLGFRVLLSLSE